MKPGERMNLKFITELDFTAVHDHYHRRMNVSRRLGSLLSSGATNEYVNLALGIDDAYGNYSAADHDLGPRILSVRSGASVFKLGSALATARSEKDVQRMIYHANIPYLKIGVGSEMAMLLQPEFHWVANTRSIWSHLLVKHRSLSKANEELKLYRTGSQDSEMAYKVWCAVHTEMMPNFKKLASAGYLIADEQRVEPGPNAYIWADAIASALYEKYVGR
jgi:hypothetical protein